jgi:hypothetical protein
MHRIALLSAASLAAAVAVGASSAAATPSNCGSFSRGPAPGHVSGNAAGASCLLRAYQDHCRAARYKLSLYGIDTARYEEFVVARVAGRCEVTVTVSFRLVPQKPRVVGRGACTSIRKSGSDVLVSNCTGQGVSGTLSLTGRR